MEGKGMSEGKTEQLILDIYRTEESTRRAMI